MKIHFDGDILVYRAGFAAEKAYYTLSVAGREDEDFIEFESKAALKEHMKKYNIEADEYAAGTHTRGEYYWAVERNVEPVENALYNVKSMIQRACDALGSDDITVYLSGPTNFRDGVATIKPYKGNRDAAHKPVHGPAIKEYIMKHYDVNMSVDEEADDCLAYNHYAMWLNDEYSTVLASTDKDLDMVPGNHYNFVKDETYYISEQEGMYLFYKQLLTGDSVDNIPGIPGIGKVKAEKLLGPIQDDELAMYDMALYQYTGAYDNGLDALIENARLLWMRRKPDEWWRPPYETE